MKFGSPRAAVPLLVALVIVLGLATTVVAQPFGNPGGGGHGGPPIDSQEVLDTLNQWALGYDEDEPELMRDAFTDDARFTYASPAFEEPLVFEGIDAVMDLFLDSIEAQDDQRRHVMSNARIERIDHRTVHVTSYLTLLVVDDPDASPVVQSTGVYRDTLVLERDGEWRIQERDLRLDTAA